MLMKIIENVNENNNDKNIINENRKINENENRKNIINDIVNDNVNDNEKLI